MGGGSALFQFFQACLNVINHIEKYDEFDRILFRLGSLVVKMKRIFSGKI